MTQFQTFYNKRKMLPKKCNEGLSTAESALLNGKKLLKNNRPKLKLPSKF